MNVLSIKDQPDGSAIVEVEMTKEEINLCIEIGFIAMVKGGMKAHEDSLRTPVPE
jgi:hypothetical protein